MSQPQPAPPLLKQKVNAGTGPRTTGTGPRSTVAKLAMDATREVDELKIREFNLHVKSTSYQLATAVLLVICLFEATLLFMK